MHSHALGLYVLYLDFVWTSMKALLFTRKKHKKKIKFMFQVIKFNILSLKLLIKTLSLFELKSSFN